MTFYDQLKTHLEAKIPAIYVETAEFLRFHEELKKCCNDLGKKYRIWNRLDGLEESDAEDDLSDYLNLIKHIRKGGLEHQITIIEDADQFFEDTEVVVHFAAMLRHMCISQESEHQIIAVAPTLNIPTAIRKDIAILDFPLPGESDIQKLLEQIQIRFELDKEMVYNGNEIIDSVRGLSTTEILNAFSKVAVMHKKITAAQIPLLLEEKEQIVRKSGYLEFIHTKKDEKMEALGGLDELKRWLKNRKIAFEEEAEKRYLSAPKGVLLLGIPGTGKSLSAKAVASEWNMPLLRLDMGRVFGQHVGASEKNMRDTIKVAESMEPCVLWIDEIEKGLGSSGGERDGGTATRVFGTFLTWMQEKDKKVFIFATANDILRLPPEFLRKGRFDEIFFVDLPGEEARKEIFNIHLARKKQKVIFTDELIKETEGFSGSEIEFVVNDALFMGVSRESEENRKEIISSGLTTKTRRAAVQELDSKMIIEQNLLNASKEIVPLSSTMYEGINRLRRWAESGCRKASKAKPPKIRSAQSNDPRPRQEMDSPLELKNTKSSKTK